MNTTLFEKYQKYNRWSPLLSILPLIFYILAIQAWIFVTGLAFLYFFIPGFLLSLVYIWLRIKIENLETQIAAEQIISIIEKITRLEVNQPGNDKDQSSSQEE